MISDQNQSWFLCLGEGSGGFCCASLLRMSFLREKPTQGPLHLASLLRNAVSVDSFFFNFWGGSERIKGDWKRRPCRKEVQLQTLDLHVGNVCVWSAITIPTPTSGNGAHEYALKEGNYSQSSPLSQFQICPLLCGLRSQVSLFLSLPLFGWRETVWAHLLELV